MKNRKNFLVIGNPIKHSLSPFLHNYWFHKNKINCEYKKLKTTQNSIKKILNRVRKKEIEGMGKDLFEEIKGDEYSVMGMPIKQLINYYKLNEK